MRFFDTEYQKATTDNARYDVEKTRGIVRAYADHYRNDTYRTVAVEKSFELPMIDTRTEEIMPGITYCGKIDCILEQDGVLCLADHKTTSKVDDAYWRELATNPQITHYMMAAEQMQLPVREFLWDVIVKPNPKAGPMKLKGQGVKKSIMADLEEGYWCGVLYPYDDWKNSDVETPRMQGIRTYLEMTKNPQNYFFRRTLRRKPDDILEWLEEINLVADRQTAVSTVKDTVRNQSNCKAFNSLCDYHDLCAGYDPQRMNYRRKESSGQSDFTSTAMSVSSINEYLSCERKWFHRKYERLEKLGAEYRQSLVVGDLLHRALEVWLSYRKSDITIEFTGCVCKQCTGESK